MRQPRETFSSRFVGVVGLPGAAAAQAAGARGGEVRDCGGSDPDSRADHAGGDRVPTTVTAACGGRGISSPARRRCGRLRGTADAPGVNEHPTIAGNDADGVPSMRKLSGW